MMTDLLITPLPETSSALKDLFSLVSCGSRLARQDLTAEYAAEFIDMWRTCGACGENNLAKRNLRLNVASPRAGGVQYWMTGTGDGRKLESQKERENMEYERDTESNASYLQSSPWWMMRSLWKKEISDERHLQASVVDSFLVEHGHPVCWYFTSSKTGRVLKVLRTTPPHLFGANLEKVSNYIVDRCSFYRVSDRR